MKYRQNKYGNIVQIVRETAERVEFFTLGGGFQRWLPVDQFHAVYDRDWVASWHQIEVGADWMGVTLKAWSTGRRWNGWAVPFFELDQALEAQKWAPHLAWHPERDCFDHKDEFGEDELVTYPGQVINVEGRDIKVYQLGDGWCWDHMGEIKS